jgi:hypothetical protein
MLFYLVRHPSVYTLLNGGNLDYGECKAKMVDAKCPDDQYLYKRPGYTCE